MRYLLSHDLGTSGNKAALWTEEGLLVRETTIAYPTQYSNSVWVEQNSDDWWKAVVEGTRAVLEGILPSDIAAVSFSGHMNGSLCVDKNGLPLRPHIMWADMRGVEQYSAIRKAAGDEELYRTLGGLGGPAYSFPKLMWVRDHEPEVFSKTFKSLQCKDYILFKMTGVFATDPSDAGLTMGWNSREQAWSESLFRAAGLDMDKFPEVKPLAGLAGGITGEAASLLGLLEGTPVIMGGGDGMMGTIGAGMAEPGDAYIYFGTSSWVTVITDNPCYDAQGRPTASPYIIGGTFSSGGAMQSGGGAYTWCKKNLGETEAEAAAKQGVSAYRLLDELAARSPAGANGVIFMPQLVGERAPFWNADAKGAFLGLRMEHSRGDMVRAVLESTAIHLTVIADTLRSNGAGFEKMVVIGGGASSPVWRQIMADSLGVPVLLPRAVEGATSMAAAMAAAVGAGIYPDLKSAMKKFVSITGKVEPDLAKKVVYDKTKALYLDCYDALKKLYPRFNDLGKAEN